MLVDHGTFAGRRVLEASTVRQMWTPWPSPDSPRALGWDVTSVYAEAMAPFFQPGSVGHTGFTGTAVWIDPVTRTYMIILTNRVHPYGNGSARIRELRTRVAAAVGAELFYAPDALQAPASLSNGEPSGPAADTTLPTGHVLTGLDVLVYQNFAPLKGHRIGGAQISPRHANFIENAEGARSADAIALMAEARRRAWEQFGVELEHEVEFLGEIELPPVSG